MYSRDQGDETFTFEPSGGLLNASLVMLDRETDSYWSIMTDAAIYGEAAGRTLEQIPGSVKTTWGDWRRRHPDTLALSVDGKEHDPRRPYDRYFESDEGFRKLAASDRRLADKAHVYGFHDGETPYAVPHAAFAGGTVFEIGGRSLFLYRLDADAFYRSTAAWWAAPGSRFVERDGSWTVEGDEQSASWSDAARSFTDAAELVEAAGGFDTFWYIWSLTNPETKLLGK